MASGSEVAQAARILNRADAERLVADLVVLMRDLESVLAEETAQLRAGRLREGLSQEARKTELATAYIRALETVKGNAIALARFAPDLLPGLRSTHLQFSRTLETNQMVLATVRAVSESLVKGLSEEMNRSSRPQSYGPALAGAAPRSQPLILSKSL